MVSATAKQAAREGEIELAARAASRDESAIRAIVKQHNRRLFRLARSILRQDTEAEDALQGAYLSAFAHIQDFRAESTLATWLSRIVINECLQRLRSGKARRADVELEPSVEARIIPFPHDPERDVAQRELVHLVELAVDSLPDDFRLVLVARTIEGMSIEETAQLLNIQPETVKTRLFRARKLLKEAMVEHLDPLLTSAFPFLGRRCDRIADVVVAAVMTKA